MIPGFQRPPISPFGLSEPRLVLQFQSQRVQLSRVNILGIVQCLSVVVFGRGVLSGLPKALGGVKIVLPRTCPEYAPKAETQENRFHCAPPLSPEWKQKSTFREYGWVS